MLCFQGKNKNRAKQDCYDRFSHKASFSGFVVSAIRVLAHPGGATVYRTCLSVFTLLVLSYCAAPINGQTPTLVSGTITDTNGVPYSFAKVSASLVGIPPNVSATIRVNGIPTAIGGQQNASADASGNFTMNLFCNSAGGGCSVISPSGTTWQFTINENGTPPPAGKGPQTCSASATITGATQSLTSSFSSCPALLNGSAGSGCTVGGGSNTLQKNNGAGGCAASSVTDDGTTVTSTDTGGLSLPSGGQVALGEESPPTCASGTEILFASSVTHLLSLCNPPSNIGSIVTGFFTTSGDLPSVSNAGTLSLGDSGIPSNTVVTQTSNAASGQVCTYTGTNKICVPATALPNGVTGTTQAAGDNSTKVATTAYVDAIPKTKALGWAFGDLATGAALTTSEIGYITVPFACTITGFHIMADAGTVTIKTARVNGGTALPTIGSNSISTSGVSLSSGTKVDSTILTDFTSTAIAANDTLGFFITAVATAKQITFQLDCKTQ